MSQATQKYVRIFPYQYRLSGTKNSVSNLQSIFNIKNIASNVIQYSQNISHLLAVEKTKGNFMFGKFMKLRRDAPYIISRIDGTERPIDLDKDEDIEETSHFIWNVKERIIFAEYNHFAIRGFSTPLKLYLDNRFGVNDNIVWPIWDVDTYQKFVNAKTGVKTFKLGVAQLNLDVIERVLDLSISGVLGITPDEKNCIKITITKGRGKEFLSKNKIVKVVDNLKTKEGALDTLWIEDEEAAYDLVKNSLLYYYAYVGRIGRYINKDEFYGKAFDIFKGSIDEIKRSVQPL